MTSRLLRTHHLSTVALLAFSFFVYALLPVGTGLNGFGESLHKMWEEIDKRHADILYLSLFVMGATVLAIAVSRFCNTALVIHRPAKAKLAVRTSQLIYKRIFTDIYNVFVAFIVLWFVALWVISAHLFYVLGLSDWLRTLPVKIAASYVLTQIGLRDITDLLLSPAFYVIWAISMLFGYRLLATWRPRKDLRRIVGGEKAQQAVSRSLAMVSLTLLLMVVIVVPGFYLGLLSASILKRADPRDEFDIQAECHLSGTKVKISVVVRNNSLWKRAVLKPIFVDWSDTDRAFRIDTGDLFWLSNKGLYFEPAETRFYRLELTAPAQFWTSSKCEARDKEPPKGFVSVKVT